MILTLTHNYQVFSVGSGVAVSLQVSHGLGHSVKSLSEDRLRGFMKVSVDYTSDLQL